ncbi:uncharacterized protein LOC110833359 isoform X3 [Zootermopsis nevadensis]|uniref:uncharacterized protein LOC110833359 isoform X3 n=1 Tax=Zootermopsis nevadensis TaxID=136037 RepID=UPI000B8E3DB0|nr:uncharacterized protein LOC110833359 isoform X3 [Zootermopsis nevadensis]
MTAFSPVFIKGTCMDMCPVRERKLREKEGLLHLLELPAGTSLQSTPTAHPYLTVKSFSRSAAGHHTPHQDELRPPDILYKTVCHLLTSTVLRQGVDWCTVYDFVFDRLRAVRQDLVIQGLGCVESIPILEPTVRFHSYAGYRQHPTVKTAFAMSLALWSGNYVRLCTLLPKLPPLLKCVAAQQLPLVRRHALQIMSCAYSSHNLTFPLSRLQTLLLYKTHKQAESDCKRYGISVKDNAVMFNKATFQPNAHGPCLYVECVDMALQSVDLTELLLLKDRAPEPTETVK